MHRAVCRRLTYKRPLPRRCVICRPLRRRSVFCGPLCCRLSVRGPLRRRHARRQVDNPLRHPFTFKRRLRRALPVDGPLRYRRTCCFLPLLQHPAFSPDGAQIAYFDGMGDWGNDLRVMNADGSNQINLSRPLYLRTISCPLDYRTRHHISLSLRSRTCRSLDHRPDYPALVIPGGTLHTRRQRRAKGALGALYITLHR